jgi:hypothetical protein
MDSSYNGASNGRPSSTGDFGIGPADLDAFVLPPSSPSMTRRVFRRLNAWRRAFVERFTLPEEETKTDMIGFLAAETPPWLVSLIVHFSLMILLGLAAFGVHDAATSTNSIEIDLTPPAAVADDEVFAETLGEQLKDPTQAVSSDGPPGNDIAALAASDLPLVDDPLVGPPVLEISPLGTVIGGTEHAPAIGLEFSGREVGRKKALLKAYGGTALTESAVHEGLRWLARQQRSRGTWSLDGPYRDGIAGQNDEAATAMALLAFQGAGYTPESGKDEGFSRIVTRGWNALLRTQHSSGQFFGNVQQTHQLYTQAICTIAACELYGMTQDEVYRDAAQRAIDYCVKTQTKEGGWRYVPGSESDMSVTGWFAMALQSARMAGIEVPSPVFERIGNYLDSVSREEGSMYAYQPRDGATLPITAEGLLSRQYLGWERDDPRLRKGVDFLLANLPSWDNRNAYYWYYGTQVCHHMEGADWQKWNAVMRQLLPEHQEKRGPERGSWDPRGDRWGNGGGRLYVTCLSLYTLEVYYRHLPIYREGLLSD